MTPDRMSVISREVTDALTCATEREKLKRLASVTLSLQSEEEQNFCKSILDVALFFGVDVVSAQVNSKRIVVALVHGIRTEAVWQEQVRSILEKRPNVKVIPIGYGYFDVVRFLLPFLRSGPVNAVRIALRDINRVDMRPDELVVVAHSFGTYVMSEILRDDPDIECNRVLFCGSVVNSSYRWDKLPSRFHRDQIINDVGTEDIWPVFARFAGWGYGASGTFGFKKPRVNDRYFNYGHSDFFSKEHVEKYWEPFLIDGNIVKSPWDLNRPTPNWWLSVMALIPLWFILFLVILATAIWHFFC